MNQCVRKTDRNFQLRNNFNLEGISMSKKKKKNEINERSKDTFQNTLFRKIVPENYPLARNLQTTLYRMIVLPASVIKTRIRDRCCGDNNSE